MIVIPNSVVKASCAPRQIVIAGLPKTGKTTLAATIPDSLILDLEDGCRYITCRHVTLNTLADFKDVTKQLIEYKEKEGKPMIKRLVIDSITRLELLLEKPALDIAKQRFSKEKDGSGTDVTSLDLLPFGAGYNIRKELMINTLNYLRGTCETLVIISHIIEKKMMKNGVEEQVEANYKCLDMKGSMGAYLAQDSDAIGMVYTNGETGVSGLSFKSGEDYRVSGCRIKECAGKDIDIIKEGKADWSSIFKD